MSSLIILCATQRCGSTMVVEDMRASGVLGVPEEYFIPWDPNKENVNWKEQLDGILRIAASDNGVVSIKIMANQLINIEQCLEESLTDDYPLVEGGGPFPYFRSVFASAKFIYIRRDSLVRQAISRVMSRKTGINHATGNDTDEHFAGNLMKGYKTDYNSSVQYDETALNSDVLSIAKENLVWESFFTRWGIANPLSLRYEEICKNSPEYLLRIARYSGVELLEADLPKDRKMVKLSNQKNDEWCEKYISKLTSSSEQ